MRKFLNVDFFLAHPELRAVGVVFDYLAGLNDAPGVRKGLWIGASGGSVMDPAAALGSVFQTLHLLRAQLDRVEAITRLRLEQLLRITESLKGKHEEAAARDRAP